MPTTEHRIPIGNKSLRKATVFEDRAELKREFSLLLKSGLNEVIIERISGSLIEDSVRVTGKGPATIEEVTVANRRVAEGSVDSQRGKELRAKKEELEKKLRPLEIEKKLLTKEIEGYDQMIGQVGSGIAAPKNASFTGDKETLASVTNFYEFYHKKCFELHEKSSSNERAAKQIQEQIAVKEHELKQIEHGASIKVISIFLDSKDGGNVDLEIIYQVWNACWDPSYDVRVDAKEGKTSMQLSYYGNVKQKTGEDWEDALLTLSTARPCVGGAIPDLGTLSVSRHHEYSSISRGSLPRGLSSFAVPTRRKCAGPRVKMSKSIEMVEELSLDDSPMDIKIASINSHTLSTEFVIARPCSIPADGAQHKVTIGIIPLEPQLVHESVPSKNACAYLSASALNSSRYPLLPGEASVYLDGAFIAKTKIKSVSPGERIAASLGIDAAVKVEYLPAQKFHEQTGLLTKWSSTVTEQKVVVRNNRPDAVLLTVREQIPLSTDDKIKVKMISPEAVEKVTDENQLKDLDQMPKVGVRLLPSNNLEWTVKLEKSSSPVLLLVKYAVDHPSSVKVDFNENLA